MHRGSQAGGAVRAAVLALALVTVAGCSHLHWPWHRTPPPAPVPVHEVDITGAGLEGAPQYWKRNTLLVDLSAARGSGSIVLRPASGAAWPVRLAFRVTPGAIGALEVSGAQHTRLPINPSGSRPVDLELDPGIYTPQSEEMTVSWGPEIAPAP